MQSQLTSVGASPSFAPPKVGGIFSALAARLETSRHQSLAAQYPIRLPESVVNLLKNLQKRSLGQTKINLKRQIPVEDPPSMDDVQISDDQYTSPSSKRHRSDNGTYLYVSNFTDDIETEKNLIEVPT